MKPFFVYIITNRPDGTLYVGTTDDLERRMSEHRLALRPGFAAKYRLKTLVWYEAWGSREGEIHRERQIKKWNRAWKVRLIESANPDWHDLLRETPPPPDEVPAPPGPAVGRTRGGGDERRLRGSRPAMAAVAAHRGRIVKFTGDGFLAEFPTAESAVTCAMKLQASFAGRAPLKLCRRMRWRRGGPSSPRPSSIS